MLQETLVHVSATVIVSDVTAPVLVCGPSEDVTTVTVDFNGSSVPEGWSVSNAAGDYDWTFGASGAINAGGTSHLQVTQQFSMTMMLEMEM